MTERVVEFAKDPVLKLNFLSHGTLEAYDLEKTRKFYTEFLGLEVVRTSPISLIIRLGGTNTIAVVQNPKRGGAMPVISCTSRASSGDLLLGWFLRAFSARVMHSSRSAVISSSLFVCMPRLKTTK